MLGNSSTPQNAVLGMASSPSVALCGAFVAATGNAYPIGLPFLNQPLKRSELVSTSHWLHIPRAQVSDPGCQPSEDFPRRTSTTSSLRSSSGTGGYFSQSEASQSASALHAVASRDAPTVLRDPENLGNGFPESVEQAAELAHTQPSAPDALKDPLRLPRVSPGSLHYPPGFLGAVPLREGSGDGAALIDEIAGPYLRKVLTSKVYDVAIKSPLEFAKKLSKKVGNKVYLKREDMQQVKCTPPLCQEPAVVYILRGPLYTVHQPRYTEEFRREDTESRTRSRWDWKESESISWWTLLVPGVFVQAPRGLQHDGPTLSRGAREGGHLFLGGQPRAGSGSRSFTVGMPCGYCHARHHAGYQVEVRQGTGGGGGSRGRSV